MGMNDENKTTNKFPCTQCGGDAEVGYSNWSMKGVDGKVVREDERLCRQCFKKRTGKLVF
jgi:hypothetical protein